MVRCEHPQLLTCRVHALTGRSRIQLKKTGEVFSLVPPPSKANNVIIGRVWIDTAGDYSLINTTTGAKCSMYFTPCGWFGSGRYEVSLWPSRFCEYVTLIVVFKNMIVPSGWVAAGIGLGHLLGNQHVTWERWKHGTWHVKI